MKNSNQKSNIAILFVICYFLQLYSMQGQQKIQGPVINDFGQTYRIPSPQMSLDKNDVIHTVFDITGIGDDPSEISSQINTIARCINMHVNAGVELTNIHIVAIYHSNGTYSILNDEAYMDKYNVRNPNSDLISELSTLGVELYVCGQSVYSRKVKPIDLHEDIKIALSAMTVLIKYQAEGYSLIKF